MKTKYYRNQSRKATPWDDLDEEDISASQSFIMMHHKKHYEQRHEKLSKAREAEIINDHIPKCCPKCNSDHFIRNGIDKKSGIQQYFCKDCHKRFTSLTGTIYDSHKIPISEWIDFLYNLFAYVSLTADSRNNRNSFTTTRYWLEKLFLILEDYQADIILEGDITPDETFYAVRTSDLIFRDDGKLPRGLSLNQICIGVACDSKHVYCVLEGYGKPSQKKTYEAFKDHIREGSRLIHDSENSHKKLMKELNLTETVYDSKWLKSLPDKQNPLNRVNQIHNLIKKFFYAHNSFNRISIKGYINLFSFMMNPPRDKLEKIDILLNLGFSNPRLLRYRDYYKVK
ncbi:MAG: IS1 family transposase [Erysipelotrichaceae bacterium]|nr:IS1 family transposase [Erysipelotrichaceae bacterium]